MDWKNFFDALGMNGTRWQWKMMRWQRYWKSFWRGETSSTGITLGRGLIYLNIGLFSAMVLLGLFSGRGISAILSPDTYLLRAAGGQYWPYVLEYGQWWRCITYAYTHGGIIHLAFNMMVLYQVGPLIENEIGPARFFVLYTAAALAATLAGLLWHPNITVIGASGSLFGLIGFAVTYYHRVGPAAHDLRNFMLKWALFAFVFGILVGADNAAHFGGAICGAILGMLLPIGVRGRQKMKFLFNAMAWLAVAATVVSLGFLITGWIVFSLG